MQTDITNYFNSPSKSPNNKKRGGGGGGGGGYLQTLKDEQQQHGKSYNLGVHVSSSPVYSKKNTKQQQQFENEVLPRESEKKKIDNTDDGKVSKKRKRSESTTISPLTPTLPLLPSPHRSHDPLHHGSTQTTLDFGQTGWQKQCSSCGMLYNSANSQDSATHARFHKKKLTPISYTGFKTQTVLKEWFDDGDSSARGGGQVIVFTEEDLLTSTAKRNKINKIRKMVDNDLNFACGSGYVPINEKTYIYVRSKKILGCVVAESVRCAYRLCPENADNLEKIPGTSPTYTKLGNKKEIAHVGISRVWVHRQYRRQKIATKLVEVVRRNFIFGETVQKESLAFSQPSEDGKIFGKSYFGTQEFLVYVCE